MDFTQDKYEKIYKDIQIHFPEWKLIDLEQIKFTRQNGLTNITFKINSNCPTLFPSQIFYREFCAHIPFISRPKEKAIFELLSDKQLAPRQLFQNQQYRLEEQINGYHPDFSVFSSQEFRRKVLYKVVEYQQIELPEEFQNKVANCLDAFNEEHPVRKEFSEFINAQKLDNKQQKLVKEIENESKQFAKQIRLPKKQRLVFSHNDLQLLNIFILEEKQDFLQNSKEGDLMFIDFEYAGYNLPTYDLADNLNESCFDYAYEKFPYFQYLEQNEVNEEKMKDLINYYLYFCYNQRSEDLKMNLNDIVKNPQIVQKELLQIYDKSTLEEKKKEFLTELKLSLLLSNLYWVVWGVTQSVQGDFNFGYWEFVEKRFNVYLKQKKQFLASFKGVYL